MPWRKGGKVSAAPIYVNGMVLTGDSTATTAAAARRMHAFDADNGRRLWTWTIVPAARAQPGGNTWPATTDSRTTAAARCGSRPLVDTKLQPRDLRHGQPGAVELARPRQNLYTDSIVALNLYTGQLVWALPDHAPRPLGLGPAEQRRRSTQVQGPVTVTKKVRVKVKGKFVTKTKKVTKPS